MNPRISDGSTLVEYSELPPSNYLWHSPDGRVLTGKHHQLILHLLSIEESWQTHFNFNVDTILNWLRTCWPQYVIDRSDLFAIANEYCQMTNLEQMAFRVTDEFALEPILNSFEPQDQSVSLSELDREAMNIGSNQGSVIVSMNDQIEQTALPLRPPPTMILQSDSSKSISDYHRSVAQNKALTDYYAAPQITFTEENAGGYAVIYLAALTDRRPEDLTGGTEVVAKEQLVTCQDSMASADTQKTGHNAEQSKIPETKSDSLVPVATANLAQDIGKLTVSSPHQAPITPARVVEGHFWYCDECYVNGTARNKRPKGRFSARPALEAHVRKHHQHDKPGWKCTTLPESE